MGSIVVELELFLHRDTHWAVQVATDEEAEPVWLPKSQIDFDVKDMAHRWTLITVSMTERLAIEKGLV